jgi:hypothetical protein
VGVVVAAVLTALGLATGCATVRSDAVDRVQDVLEYVVPAIDQGLYTCSIVPSTPTVDDFCDALLDAKRHADDAVRLAADTEASLPELARIEALLLADIQRLTSSEKVLPPVSDEDAGTP